MFLNAATDFYQHDTCSRKSDRKILFNINHNKKNHFLKKKIATWCLYTSTFVFMTLLSFQLCVNHG